MPAVNGVRQASGKSIFVSTREPHVRKKQASAAPSSPASARRTVWPVFRLSPVRLAALVAVRDWDGETMAIREFRGEFDLSEQRELSVGFGGEYAGGSFRRSETRLSGA